MRAFVVGTGPSLLQTNLDLIKDEFSYSVNAIHKLYGLTKWRPNVLVIGDVDRAHRAWVDKRRYDPTIPADDAIKRFLQCVSDNPQAEIWIRKDYQWWANEFIGPHRASYFDTCSHHNLGHPQDWSKAPESWHPPQICRHGGGILMAIQMAVLAGHTPIYVLGCDLGYRPGDANHCVIEYGDALLEHQAVALNKALDHAHRLAWVEADKRGVEIFNAAPGGQLEAYPRVKLENVL